MSTAKGRPVQHVDRKSLYTNLEARIRYLHSFLDFGAGPLTPTPRRKNPPLTISQVTLKPSDQAPSTSRPSFPQ
jgi:hypothetical protein